ncbi:DnaJ heat shock family protein [Klebsormidium nitens]|uniref:DnaJ heat shock family protein n=1 Tax=Klebsormidium nitens TaxID=105231 RepID=A0A1Y1IV38_KLENI|nr:DnaJ heat shock family protein [Klebsormidium nitens]|eukprot:GAQ92118.1 DnaJ heat shock family protein [Klebsormidium nitens]
MDNGRRCRRPAAGRGALLFSTASGEDMQASQLWLRRASSCMFSYAPVCEASAGVRKQGFHSTPPVAAKPKKANTGSGQTEDKKKKVNNKGSHKKQKRMEAKAKLNEWRDWCNGQTSTDQGFTYIFSGGQAFFTSEVFNASQRRRARQSRRDRDAQWSAAWEQWEPGSSRTYAKTWVDMDLDDFWEKVFGGQHFGEEEEEDIGREQRSRKARSRSRGGCNGLRCLENGGIQLVSCMHLDEIACSCVHIDEVY